MATRYWVGGTGNWTDTSKWSTTSGGAGGSSVPTASDDVIIDSNSGAGSISISILQVGVNNAQFNCKSLTFNPRTSNASLGIGGTVSGTSYYAFLNVHGNLKIHSTTFIQSFAPSVGRLRIFGTATIEGQSNSIFSGIALGDGGSNTADVTLLSNVSFAYMYSNAGSSLEMNGYSLTLRNKDYYGTAFNADPGTVITNSAPTGQFFINCMGGSFTAYESPGINIPNVSIINVGGINQSGNTNSAFIFAGGGGTYGAVTYQAYSAITNYYLYGSSTIRELNLNGYNTVSAASLRFDNGSTNIVDYFNVNGTSTYPLTLRSLTNGQQFTIQSSNVQESEYLNIRDSVVTGPRWRAITSTDLGNNIGWDFYSTPVREAKGTLVFSGGTNRKALYKREAKGAIKFSGSAYGVIRKDPTSIDKKKFMYKVYDEDDNLIEVWRDVVSEPNWTEEINVVGSTMQVELARNSDSRSITTQNLLDSDNNVVLDSDNKPVLTYAETRNNIGPGTSVDYNNRVDLIVFYGTVGPIEDTDGDIILDSWGQPILGVTGAPNGRRIFTAYISDINSRYGNTESTVVDLTSYGADLQNYLVQTSGGDTTVPYFSTSPANIVKGVIDNFVEQSEPEGSYTHRTESSIEDPGTIVSYTFRADTTEAALLKSLQLMPSNYYLRVDLGTNVINMQERASQAHHVFYLGKHIKSLDLKGSIRSVVNDSVLTGGGEPALYLRKRVPLAPRTRRGLAQISDLRVEDEDSAEILVDDPIQRLNKVQYRTTVTILAVSKNGLVGYDIESINIGDMVTFRNTDNYAEELLLQVVGKTYWPDEVQLALDTLPPDINKRLEDIKRNMVVSDNQYVPDAPIEV